ncbi:MAG: hypothetical protein K2M75_06375, partial [Clostridia bacterium]|nr:hypothetical protein [Clostridia bacterium]
MGSDYEMITVELESDTFTYDGNAHGGELKVTSGAIDITKIDKKYYKNSVSEENLLDSLPTDAGEYVIVLSLSEEDEEEGYALSKSVISYTIEKAKIKAEWNTSGQIPVIANLDDKLKEIVGYIYYDEAGNELEDGATLEVGKSYKVKAILKGEYGENYEFVADDGETVLDDPTMSDTKDFTVEDKKNNGQGGNAGIGSGNGIGGSLSFDNASKLLKEWWQVIASIISIILIIIFTSKGADYANKRKKAKKTMGKYSNYYAGATGLFGLAMTAWTVIACVLMGLAVLSFVYMILQKRLYVKAQDELDEAKDEYERNKKDEDKENMRMMLMGMMSGNAGGMGGMQSGYAYAQQGISAEDMRLMINDAVAGLLPNVQQYLPQQASTNDDVINRLVENQELLMKKMSEQPVEREIASSKANDDIIVRVVEKTEQNDETIKQLLKNQEKLMEKIVELSAAKPVETQVVEKVIEKEVPVEKIVEKVVEVPVEVEKIIEKEVPVEKIVEIPV